MKLTLILSLFGLFQVSAISYSQATRLSLEVRDKQVAEILREIEQISDFRFFYQREQVDVERTVSLKVRNKPIEEILTLLFPGNEIAHKIFADKLILIAPRHILEQSGEGSLQPHDVQGTVTNTSGEPLPGVALSIKGTSMGTITDLQGRFSLSNVPDDVILVFSFIGMKTQEIPVGDKTTINVTMEEDFIGLEELVVIGYGSVKKSDLTGSVSSVKTDELIETPITSIDQGLVGRAAGVLVTQSSGMPGAIASIRIRGNNSIQGGNEPLYVIDGFPIYNGNGFGNTGEDIRFSGLATLNPADIESIEILKDASATSIYGARATNGVVLITTKKGKKGQNRITFDTYYGIQNVTKRIDVMNALQYATLLNEADMNDGSDPTYDAAAMSEIQANPEGTDWQDEVFDPAAVRNYQLTFSGGNNNLVYLLSANSFNQDGIVTGSDFKRHSMRLNLESNVLRNFRVGSHLHLSRSNANAVPSSVTRGALIFNPVLPVYQDELNGIYTLVNSPGATLIGNPIATAKEAVRETTSNRVLADVFGEWEIIPGLRAKTSFGVDVFDIKADNFLPSFLFEAISGTAEVSIRSDYHATWLNENTLSYSKQINDNHSISAVAGFTMQQNNSEHVMAAARDFVTDKMEENSLQGGAVFEQPSSSQTEWRILSYLGRANYNFKDKFLLSVTGRVDGSSRFGDNNKYAFFPAASAAWRLSEEEFIKQLGIFSSLKLRAGYGVTGNQEIGLYGALSTLGSGITTIDRTLVTTFYPNQIPNPNLRWEKTAQVDIGLDMGLLNNKLRITADVYNKMTTDLLYNLQVPLVSGFNEITQNIGNVRNYGIELSFESYNVTAGNFRWISSFNIAFNRNEVLDLGPDEFKDVGTSGGFTGQVRRLIVGEPIGLFYGYVSDGLYRTQAEVDAGPTGPTTKLGGQRFKDLSGPDGAPDGVIDANYDKTVIGDANPDFFGGFVNTFAYKGFEANAFFQFSYGNDIYNDGLINLTTPNGNHNVLLELEDRWTPQNTDAKYPVATRSLSGLFSDLYIEDGSYLKLKTLTLSYNFPGLRTDHIGGLRLYVTGQNIWTLTRYSGFDPEVSANGVTTLEIGEDDFTYPQVKTFMIGIKLDIQ